MHDRKFAAAVERSSGLHALFVGGRVAIAGRAGRRINGIDGDGNAALAGIDIRRFIVVLAAVNDGSRYQRLHRPGTD